MPKLEDRNLARAATAEALGTALLLAAIVGSGVMAQRLTPDAGLELMCNTAATACALFVIIVIFVPLSGAHFNPVVTMVALFKRAIAPRTALVYIAAQIMGAIAGVWLAHAMFGETVFALGVKTRSGTGQWLSEAVASFGLILTILGLTRKPPETIAGAIALYIGAAYWFTASTSFANPAVTLARALTPSFAGIRPIDAPGFIGAQILGAILGFIAARFLFPDRTKITSGG